tara:strand:- start:176 stop:547 length:372 start_codon:yes stop_codon:yes gene_type:complete
MEVEMLERNSKELQNYLLNPKSGDNYTCRFPTPEGEKLCNIAVGRKWVVLRWHELEKKCSKKLSLKLFVNHAFVYWRFIARNDASYKAMDKTGSYKKPKGWWKDYGFSSNPEDVIVSGLAYKF